MNILKQIKHYAKTQPLVKAMKSGEQEITYDELDRYSDCLADYLDELCGENKEPIVVYGHKSIYMLVCMLACVKSGRGYCPIDVSVPDLRTQIILDKMESPLVLATEQLNCKFQKIIDIDEIRNIVEAEVKTTVKPQGKIGKDAECRWVKGDETYYVIFTSGSTGEPKGVEITANCLNNYLEWSVNLGNTEAEKQGKCFLNQAPFSFDLSVMDLYTCLACGGTLWSLSKEVQSDYKLLMQSLKDSNAAVWVSTPSFAEICLADKQFNEALMPKIEIFLFCGETLSKDTVKKLQNRFPHGKILNLYGPTESTVAVTQVTITEKMCMEEKALPVGSVKPGSWIEIIDRKGKIVIDGEKGEIVILGNTVSSGYYKETELSKKAFLKGKRDNREIRGYHTGDEGYLKDGMLYYCGRMDLQVKLHGYRIEIEDIENNLIRLGEIERAVVIPNHKDGRIKSLSAYIVYKRDTGNEGENPALGSSVHKNAVSLQLKNRLKEFLPDYMIPKKLIFLEKFPLTNNGKVDRKRLEGMEN